MERAIDAALGDGCRTADLAGPERGGQALSCSAMAQAIAGRIAT